jgi:exosome complex component CSL4
MTESERPWSGDHVTPGEPLGVIEEFVPGNGTFEENGNIYSAVAGTIIVDKDSLEISVKQENRPFYAPRIGEIVEGVVTYVKAKVVLVNIVRTEEKEFPLPVVGTIHISNLSNRYIDKIDHAIAEDDYIRAKVIATEREPLHLTMVGPDLGVLHSLCRWCGGKLVKGHRELVCTRCKRRDTRAISRSFNQATLEKLEH